MKGFLYFLIIVFLSSCNNFSIKQSDSEFGFTINKTNEWKQVGDKLITNFENMYNLHINFEPEDSDLWRTWRTQGSSAFWKPSWSRRGSNSSRCSRYVGSWHKRYWRICRSEGFPRTGYVAHPHAYMPDKNGYPGSLYLKVSKII